VSGPSIWVGFDPREAAAFAVARHTIRKHLTLPIPVYGLVLAHLQKAGLYKRPIEWKPSAADKPVMWDTISDAPMSTEHANARFLVPHLARQSSKGNAAGWALFTDGDTMSRSNYARVFEGLDGRKAVYCVHHKHEPKNTTKMDGQIQTAYPRKNWTSFILFNCDHPSIRALTPSIVNTLPGRDLHGLRFLRDEEIGELDASWNFLVGHSDPKIEPANVHFTDGPPDMAGYRDVPYADEWREELYDWASGAMSLPG
jgi:hypothetical protein